MCTVLLPGFVDLQINGYLGVDYSSPDLEESQFRDSCRKVLSHGIAAFLPTIITSTRETYCRNLPIIARVIQEPEFKGRIPGIHLEGPFISPEPGAVGCHNPDWVRNPDVDFLKELLQLADGTTRLLTVAACRPNAAEVTKYAVRRGVVVSLGHQIATFQQLMELAHAGATALTHLGNGLPNLIPRLDNPIWSGLAATDLTVMAIADGHHLPFPVLKTMINTRSPSDIVVVSDAAPLAGLPPGEYQTLGNTVKLEENGYLHNPEKECMVGSSATVFECMNHLADIANFIPIDIDDMMKMGRENPLRLLGVKLADICEDVMVKWNGVVFSIIKSKL